MWACERTQLLGTYAVASALSRTTERNHTISRNDITRNVFHGEPDFNEFLQHNAESSNRIFKKTDPGMCFFFCVTVYYRTSDVYLVWLALMCTAQLPNPNLYTHTNQAWRSQPKLPNAFIQKWRAPLTHTHTYTIVCRRKNKLPFSILLRVGDCVHFTKFTRFFSTYLRSDVHREFVVCFGRKLCPPGASREPPPVVIICAFNLQFKRTICSP